MPPRELLRIQEVSAAVGLTPRAIRFYEEQGLLTPSARSEGSYRLFDAEDVERLRTIKAFRDEAGFSIAEIAELLTEQSAAARAKAAFHGTADPQERRELLIDAIARIDRQLGLLRAKIERLQAMTTAAEERRDKVASTLADLEPAPAGAPRATLAAAAR